MIFGKQFHEVKLWKNIKNKKSKQRQQQQQQQIFQIKNKQNRVEMYEFWPYVKSSNIVHLHIFTHTHT